MIRADETFEMGGGRGGGRHNEKIDGRRGQGRAEEMGGEGGGQT